MTQRIEFRTKDETERFVFEMFAPVCPLGIETFESREVPEPDILATLVNGDKIAFELTEIEDPNVLRLLSTNLPLNLALSDAAKHIVEPERWRGFFVSVHFTDEVKMASRVNYIDRIIKTLNENEPGQPYYGIRDEKQKLLVSLAAHMTDFQNDVYISISNATGVGDYTIPNITKKFSRKYNTMHPKHLLAWTRRTWEPQDWRHLLPALFIEQEVFARIWVFAYGNKRIEFDSGLKT